MEAAEDPLISRFGKPIRMDQIQHLFTACFLQLLRLQGKFSAITIFACTYNTSSFFCLIHTKRVKKKKKNGTQRPRLLRIYKIALPICLIAFTKGYFILVFHAFSIKHYLIYM